MASKAANLFASIFIIVSLCVMLVDAALLAKDLVASVMNRTRNYWNDTEVVGDTPGYQDSRNARSLPADVYYSNGRNGNRNHNRRR